MPPPMILVHGAFCGGWAFEQLAPAFEAAGHQVLTPDLRGHAPGAAAGAVAGVSMGDYAGDIVALCQSLPEPPILVGHSMGGLVAQMAAVRTPVAALVLLAPSAAWGGAPASVQEAITAFGLHFLGPYWARTLPPDRTTVNAYLLQSLPKVDRDAAFRRMVAESGRAVFETLNWWLDPFMTTRVDPARLNAPSLVMVGSRDVVHPPEGVRASASKIGATFRELPGMGHWLLSEPGWLELAAITLKWLADEEVSALA